MADLGAARPRIVVVTEGGPHVWGIVNALTNAFGPIAVLMEQPSSKWSLLRGRARRLGLVSATGQFGTMMVIRMTKRLVPNLARRNIRQTGLDTTPPREEHVVRIRSADSAELTAAIAQFAPSVVLLAGCRMLSPATLRAIPCPVLNYHAGITPRYRGTNGGYWALATGDPDSFGTTVHLVDTGVDTGDIVYQARGEPLPGDTIATYPLTQAAFSREICVRAVADALAGKLRPAKGEGVSMQWYHPTLWAYVWTGLRSRVW